MTVMLSEVINMGRRKLPEAQILDTMAIKLSKPTIKRLEGLGQHWGCKPSTAGRALLEFGLTIYEALKERAGDTDPFHLILADLIAEQENTQSGMKKADIIDDLIGEPVIRIADIGQDENSRGKLPHSKPRKK